MEVASADDLFLGKQSARSHQHHRCDLNVCGGAQVFANLLDLGLVDEEFLTYCPSFVGRSLERCRPSYTKGVAWTPDTAHYSQTVSIHKPGNCIFLPTRCLYPARYDTA